MSEPVQYAFMQSGEIINVITGSLAGAQAVARAMTGDIAVVPLVQVPLEVKERYRYWNERP